MVLLIDAYNVLKRAIPQEYIEYSLMREFVRAIQQRAASRGYVAIVVFDGEKKDSWGDITAGSVKTMYSGKKMSADEVLCGLMDRFVHKEAVLVSADNELIRYARSKHMSVVEIDFFWDLLKRPNEPLSRETTSNLMRLSGGSDEDAWLEKLYAESQDPLPKKEEPQRPRISVGHKINKKTRKKERIEDKI